MGEPLCISNSSSLTRPNLLGPSTTLSIYDERYASDSCQTRQVSPSTSLSDPSTRLPRLTKKRRRTTDLQRVIRPAWLLRQADELGYRQAGPGQPRNSNLRRAVSAAYYALFHAIGWTIAGQLLPAGSLEERAGLTRSVDHGALRNVCAWIAKGESPPQHVADLVNAVRADTLMVDVAEAFLELREKRHAADYDHLTDFSKEAVLNLVDSARSAVKSLEQSEAAGSATLARFVVLASLKTSIR